MIQNASLNNGSSVEKLGIIVVCRPPVQPKLGALGVSTSPVRLI